MIFENRKYAIINNDDFQLAVSEGRINVGTLFDKILETSQETLRYSLNNNYFIIKSDNVENMAYLRQRANEENVGYEEYTHSEILNIVNAWPWVNVESSSSSMDVSSSSS